MIRLDKFLADTGYGTRSKTKQLVRSGAVLINGEKAPSSDVKINPESDIVTVNGKTADQILEQRGISPTSLYGLGIRFAAFTAIALTWPITVIKNLFGLFN